MKFLAFSCQNMFDMQFRSERRQVLRGGERSVKSAEHEQERYNALLPVDNFIFLGVVFESQNRAHKVIVLVGVKIGNGAVREGEFGKIFLKRQTFVAFPRIRALIFGDKEHLFAFGENLTDSLLFGV